jgi:hypothetical protein
VGAGRVVGDLLVDVVDAAAEERTDTAVPEVRARVDGLTDEYPLYENDEGTVFE